MSTDNIKRLSRLVAIVTQLQTRQYISAATLAQKFDVSQRTIYRDIKALEQAGMPIIVVDGKGYALMDGYKMPPIMFTEQQANALVLAQQLVLQNSDASLVNHYIEAVEKVKAVLRPLQKEKANILADRTTYDQNLNRVRLTDSIAHIQHAITHYLLINMQYTNASNIDSERIVEPFALISTSAHWLLIAWCRMRSQFRFFRLDRIVNMEVQTAHFSPHKMTLQEYFEKYHNPAVNP